MHKRKGEKKRLRSMKVDYTSRMKKKKTPLLAERGDSTARKGNALHGTKSRKGFLGRRGRRRRKSDPHQQGREKGNVERRRGTYHLSRRGKRLISFG